jgi:NADH:ubiquinone oxidoreductase subunit 2 (subunit N)
MKFILRYLELIFTVAGLVVIFAAALVFSRVGASYWRVAAITATIVGVIHGILFWVVRRRQRAVRRAVIADVQAMLKDMINNQLAVILAMSELREARAEETRRASDYISRSVSAISGALQHMSDESLRSWLVKYRTPDSASPFDAGPLR